MRIRTVAAVVAVISAAACGTARPAAARAGLSAPGAAVFTNLALRDATVMQSLAYDPVHRVWVFAQVSSARPLGDLTLTRVSASGARLGWMHLRGFGHGLSIGAEPCGTGTCVWTEAHAVAEPALGWADAGAYGTGIARFTWRNSATITPSSTGVERFAVNGNAPEQTPSVDVADGLIAVQYWSAGLHVFRWAVYSLAAFRRHSYAALARFTVPAQLGAGQPGHGGELAGGRGGCRHVLRGHHGGRPGGKGDQHRRGRVVLPGAGGHGQGRVREPVHRVRVRRRWRAAR